MPVHEKYGPIAFENDARFANPDLNPVNDFTTMMKNMHEMITKNEPNLQSAFKAQINRYYEIVKKINDYLTNEKTEKMAKKLDNDAIKIEDDIE